VKFHSFLTLALEVGLLQKHSSTHNLMAETSLIWSQNSSIHRTKTFIIISTTGHKWTSLIVY